MQGRKIAWATGWVLALAVTAGCDNKSDAPQAAASAAPMAESAAPAEPAEPPPGGCKASGTEPVKLADVLGDVFGFGQDGTTIYYTSWQYYGGRGDLGAVRKDGKGAKSVASLGLEPRDLAVDDKTIYFTSGIHLMTFPKDGEHTSTLVDVFSSKAIALDGSSVYGVPGDYGPYDRVAKAAKKNGEVEELATTQRPEGEKDPVGFSRVAVDANGIYVTDSGKDRVLAYALKGGQPKVLTAGVKKPFDLAADDENLYFNLALDGQLMSVSKKGGKARKLAKGLVKKAHIAGDGRTIYADFAGEKDDAPTKLCAVSVADGKVTPVADVPGLQTVDAIAVDGACVYWAVHVESGKSVVYARAR